MDPQTIISALALSVILTAILVTGRLLWCLIVALHARRYKIASISFAGLICIIAAFATVVVVWFGYAVHTPGKTSTRISRYFS